MKNSLIPRIKTACLQTSSLAVSILKSCLLLGPQKMLLPFITLALWLLCFQRKPKQHAQIFFLSFLLFFQIQKNLLLHLGIFKTVLTTLSC